MKKIKHIITLLTLVLSVGSLAYAGPTDSIGTKVKNGKIFILHKVEKAQGLFSISRKYGVALNDIIQANPGSDEILHVDQILMIPTGKDAPMEEQLVKEYFSEDKPREEAKPDERKRKSTFARYHTVAAGETLYSISVLYNTKVDVIKNLNALETDVLSVGQQIMVPASEEDKKIEENKIVAAEQRIQETKSETEQLREAIKPSAESDAIDVVEETSDMYQVTIEKMPKYNVEKVSEKGYVQVLDRNVEISSNNLRVCSHHTAKVGSTIMVTNPTNKKSVFVKVVENHTMDGTIGNLIKLSPTALGDIEVQDGAQVYVSFAR